MKSILSKLQFNQNSRGILSFRIEVSHEGLMKHKLIQGPTAAYVENKAFLQAKQWDSYWAKMKSSRDREELAQFKTREVKKELDKFKTLLSDALSDESDFLERLKDFSSFSELQPSQKPFPSKPILRKVPDEPVATRLPFHTEVPGILLLIPWVKRQVLEKYNEKVRIHSANFQNERIDWAEKKNKIEKGNKQAQDEYDASIEKILWDNQNEIQIWNKRRAAFLEKQRSNNEQIDYLRESYSTLEISSVTYYFSTILEISEYPEYFPKDFRIEYIQETNTILIDYHLPDPDLIKNAKEFKFNKSRNEIIEKTMSASEHSKLYDDILYQITLRTIYEMFKADSANAVEAVIFNGWVRSINRSTGQKINPCVMSLHCKKTEFQALNLSNIDPKMCFKFLKGIGSSKLFSLAGITPILQIQKPDHRFVPGYDVASELEETFNLATMDWEDFEHLIRELFEKEFSKDDCEVKVTRASRDGGVDAVIFNPDPIHGGKIVIQAKRYTNPVGVSAVRDLYGTVLNEGANKGILVTTSDFGPDSYSFANGKPLTLFNGGNLLQLLEKHGHKAKIDLKEAKQETYS